MKSLLACAVFGLMASGAHAQSWTFCAAENQTCSFSGTKQVRYGTTTQNVVRTLSGPVACNNGTFGDPVFGEVKSCWTADSQPSVSTVTPSLQASRTSGVAPLAVLFDASGSTATDVALPFHQLTYSFNFGDPRNQNWTVSGLSKNTQVGGPIAAHVFELPGTYTVSVRVQKSDGTFANATSTVTVQDPNVVFAGNKTICVTQTDYVGCPTGAVQASAVLPSSYAGKRVLLRRGGSYGALAPQVTDTGFQIGAFGTGAKPIVQGLQLGNQGGVASWANDLTVMDLDLGEVNIEVTTSRFTLLRNDIKRPGAGTENMVNVGSAVPYYYEHGNSAVRSGLYWPREVFLVENDILGKIDSTKKPNLALTLFAQKSAILGNTADRSGEHTFRLFAGNKVAIAHNAFGGNHVVESNGIGVRGAMKIHAAGTQAWTANVSTSVKPMTNQIVVANNRIGSTTYPGTFLSGFGPQNADPGTVEGLQDCIAENNVYVRGPWSIKELDLRGRRLTARANTLQGGGTPSISRSDATFGSGMAAWDGPYFIQN